MMILIRLSILFIFLSLIRGNIYLYFTEDSSSVEYYDCIFHNTFVYCRRPTEPISLYREKTTWTCYHKGIRHSFYSMWSNNISVNTIVHEWKSTLEMAGKYSKYKEEIINKSNIDNENYLCQCNINSQSFGKYCEYLLPIGMTFQETINGENEIKKNNDQKTQIHSDILCYKTLECNSGLLCLDWRDICDGIQQCMFGYDEENCDKLEFNECENDEYRCMNGMCIPNEYFIDGEYDCMDLTDEKGSLDNRICALEQVSLECDERLCPPNQWSCGDGQCIENRLAFQDSLIISSTCINRRDQYFMCETHKTERMWTMPNGKCYTSDDYEEKNISIIDDCIYFIKCALSEGVEKNCPCKMDDSCYNNLENPCSDKVIQYPNGGIIAPYIFFYYDKSHDWLDNIPDFIKINASIKCRGYIINYHDTGEYSSEFTFRELEYKICSSDYKLSDNGYNEFCYNNCRTFNNRSYNFIDICKNSRECISIYRIRDGFINCYDQLDEYHNEFILNTCSNIKHHRFQCSIEESTCLYVNSLGNLNFNCDNKYDESWMGTGTKLSKMNCNYKLKDDCELIRQYIKSSWNFNINSSLVYNLTNNIIPFRAYCDSFWDFYSKKDENIILCQQWWICLENQWQCQTGQCIDIEWVLDGEWDCSDASDEYGILFSNNSLLSRNLKLINQSYINETFEKLYKNSPLMTICNPEKEFPCYRINSSDPLKDLINNRPCINLEKLGDGHIDCLGGLDEQNTIDFCHRATMLGENFKCLSSNICISYSVICEIRCPNKTDDNILCYGQNRSSNCSDLTADFICFDGSCAKGGWCDGKPQCIHGEDEYLCGDSTETPNKFKSSVHRSEKENGIQYENQLFQLPHVPKNTNGTKPIDILPSTTPKPLRINNLHEIESSLISYVCNRGIGIFTLNKSIVCFCPQQYYGDRCQYYNDRITLIFHMNFSQSIYTASSDPTILLKMLVLFIYEDEILSSYEFHTRPTVEINKFYKKIDHIIYSRSNQSLYNKRKRYFNRTNIIYEQPYSIRIEAYHIKTNKKGQLIAVWQYPIYFDFLPSYRFSKILYLIKTEKNQNPCLNNSCEKYQECYQLHNNKLKYICLCKENYRGKNCSELDQLCSNGYCSKNALCKPNYRGLLNRYELPYCICPRNTFGFQCTLLQDQCNSNPCQNKGTCFQSATPGDYFCVCNSYYQGKYCEFEKETIRLYINKTFQYQTAIIQYFYIDFSDLKLILDHQYLYDKLPNLLFYHQNKKFAPEIILLKLYSNKQNEIHLISLQTYVTSINTTIEINENNHCRNIYTLFNNTEEISPIKYHHICIKNHSLLCFYDENYLCICDSTHSRVECFNYDHNLDQCSYCMAGAQCVKGDYLDNNNFLCVCPLCHSGRYCQFSSESFSFTLDQLFSADILSTNKFIRYTTIYLLIIGSLIIFFCGLINNIFSFVTFRRPKCRRNGSGQYLLFMSIINQINLGLFTLRLIHLTINIINRSFRPTVNNIICSLLNYLLTASSRITYWLVSLIAIERVYTTIFLNKRWLKKPHIARRLIVLISISILITGAYELVFVKSHSGFNNDKSAICILEFPSRSPIWMYIHQVVTIINALLPFLINLCCMITITYVVVKKKMHISERNIESISRTIRRSSSIKMNDISINNEINKDQQLTQRQIWFYLLYEVLSENKELVIGPAFTLVPQLFSLPLFIASILLVCQTIETSPMRYLLIISYLTSFIPQLISFFLYISPSSLYYKEWLATNISKRIKAFKQCRRHTTESINSRSIFSTRDKTCNK